MQFDLRTMCYILACYAAMMITTLGVFFSPLSDGARLNSIVLIVWLTGAIALYVPFRRLGGDGGR
jgi:hypothetical protein